MIGLRRNKRGDMVLTIDSYIDIDSTPDIQPDYFDCIYINTKSERAFHAILFGASPILSWKCSYKPIFVNTALSGKEQIIDYIVDAYVSDMNNEKVYEIIDKIKLARQKFGVKSETSRPTQPNQLFANPCFGIHKVVKVAVGIAVFHILSVNKRSRIFIVWVEGFFYNRTCNNISDFCSNERSTFTGLYMLKLNN